MSRASSRPPRFGSPPPSRPPRPPRPRRPRRPARASRRPAPPNWRPSSSRCATTTCAPAYRRRSQQEIERRALDAHALLLRDWLEVVDSVDRALALDQGAELREGLRAVLDQMQGVLKRHGAERIDAEGQPFDPNLHEAISTVTSADHAPNVVVHVARAGWRLADRVLRPAQVVVAKAPEEVSHGGDRDA
ncbi:MAG: nucleotide exchange factor GrpE [Solirubrobacterales bacterium]|nr:nucleotide exchange factor GrpE [Solirubrobacterales bacterium]